MERMTKVSVLGLVLILFSSSAQAFYSVKEGVFVYDPSKTQLPVFMAQHDLTIDHVTQRGYEVYGPEGTKLWLKKLNLLYWENSSRAIRDGDYPTFQDLQAKLLELHSTYPLTTRLFSIGKTVTGKDLWVMKIARDAARDHMLPVVKLISSMHGDEITGREMMVMLIEQLLSTDGKDARITALVDNTEIYILPSMNPDGTEAHTRGNGNSADLNRDFPDFMTADNQDKPDGRQPETQAVMKFQATRQFALSANFHGGAEVVNYMWDGQPALHPFDSLLQQISLGYASQVPYLRDSTEFPHGITNGFAWYLVNGGMQDWSYHWYNDTQFTIELSGVKWPDFSEMQNYYSLNLPALLGFLETVHQGAGFYFGQPGLSGHVEIFAKEGTSPDKTLGAFGFWGSEFYKVLEPGSYRMDVTLSDGRTQSFQTTVKAKFIYPNGNYTQLK